MRKRENLDFNFSNLSQNSVWKRTAIDVVEVAVGTAFRERRWF
jgi:hypothetical protein